MSFINEYISDEDMKKYDMEEHYYSFYPGDRSRGGPSSTYKFNWVIDRERGSYLYLGKIGKEEGPQYKYWLLNIAGDAYRVRTVRAPEGSGNLNDDPFIMVWDLEEVRVYVYGQSILSMPVISPSQEMIQTLKEALTAYGYSGIIRQVDNTVVKFNF